MSGNRRSIGFESTAGGGGSSDSQRRQEDSGTATNVLGNQVDRVPDRYETDETNGGTGGGSQPQQGLLGGAQAGAAESGGGLGGGGGGGQDLFTVGDSRDTGQTTGTQQDGQQSLSVTGQGATVDPTQDSGGGGQTQTGGNLLSGAQQGAAETRPTQQIGQTQQQQPDFRTGENLASPNTEPLGMTSREFDAVARVANRRDDIERSDLQVQDGRVTLTEAAREEQFAEGLERRANDPFAGGRPAPAPGPSREPLGAAATDEIGGLGVELGPGAVTTETQVSTGPGTAGAAGAQGTLTPLSAGLPIDTRRVQTLTESGQQALEQAQLGRVTDILDARTPETEITESDVTRTDNGFGLTAGTRRELAAGAIDDQTPFDVTADMVTLSDGQAQLAPAIRDRLTETEAPGQGPRERVLAPEPVTLADRRREFQQIESVVSAKQDLREQAADVYSERLNFDVPTTAVDVTEQQRDGQTVFVPELDTAEAKAAGRGQTDIFSPVVGASEYLLERYTPANIEDTGSAINVRAVEEFAGQNQISQGIGEDAQETLRGWSEGYQETVVEPGGEIGSWWLRYGNPIGLPITAAEKGIRAATGTQTDTPITGRYTTALAEGGLSLFDPQIAATAIEAGDVGVTSAQRIAAGEGGQVFGALGATGAVMGADLTETAIENPAETGGMLVGSSVAGTAVSPFRVTRLDVPTEGAATRLPRPTRPSVDVDLPGVRTGIRAEPETVEVDVSDQRAITGVAPETPTVDVEVPGQRNLEFGRPSVDLSRASLDVEGPGLERPDTLSVRGLRLEAPPIVRPFTEGVEVGGRQIVGSRNIQGRTLVGARGLRPTLGTPEVDVERVDFERMGEGKSQQGPVFEPLTPFETDVFTTSARAAGGDIETRIGAIQGVLDRAESIGGRAATRSPESAESVIRVTEDISDDVDAEELAGTLADIDATIFGSGAVRAQLSEFRDPGDIDIVVPEKGEAAEQLADVRGVDLTAQQIKQNVRESPFDVKEAEDFAGLGQGEIFGFGRRSQRPLTTEEGVRVNPAGEELQRKAGASGFFRAPGQFTEEVDVGPRPNPGGDPRFKDVEDTAEIGRALLGDVSEVREFERAFGLAEGDADTSVTSFGELTLPGTGVFGGALAGDVDTEVSRRQFGFGGDDRGMFGAGRTVGRDRDATGGRTADETEAVVRDGKDTSPRVGRTEGDSSPSVSPSQSPSALGSASPFGSFFGGVSAGASPQPESEPSPSQAPSDAPSVSPIPGLDSPSPTPSESPEPSPSPSPFPSTAPSPSPEPSPEPSPQPSPDPSPQPSPSPFPSLVPSPGPSPDPSPSPNPGPTPGRSIIPGIPPGGEPGPPTLPQNERDDDSDEDDPIFGERLPAGTEFANPLVSGESFVGFGGGFGGGQSRQQNNSEPLDGAGGLFSGSFYGGWF